MRPNVRPPRVFRGSRRRIRRIRLRGNASPALARTDIATSQVSVRAMPIGVVCLLQSATSSSLRSRVIAGLESDFQICVVRGRGPWCFVHGPSRVHGPWLTGRARTKDKGRGTDEGPRPTDEGQAATPNRKMA